MALKEDYYSGVGSNMHAAYNIQIIVSKGIALTYYVGQGRTDFYAFIPAIEQFRADYGFYPKSLCADAGYGSWKNYAYMAKRGIGNYVKFQDWEQLRKGNAMDLYSFDGEGELVYLNGKTATRCSEYNGRHPKGHGYLYVIENCRRCECQKACKFEIKDKKTPIVDAKTFEKKIRKKDINESLRLEHRKKKKVS